MKQKKSTSGGKKVATTSKTVKKKTPQSKQAAIAEERAAMVNRQKAAILLFAAALFLGSIVFIEGQSIWTSMHNGILGLFGYCAFLWPIMLIYLAAVCAFEKPVDSMINTLLGVTAFIILIAGTIHIFANNELYLRNESIGLQISAAWNERVNTPNGGVFGALVGGVIAKLFGKIGAQITVILVSAVILMFVTKTTLAAVFKLAAKPMKKINETAKARKANPAQTKEKEKAPAVLPIPPKPFNPPKVIEKTEPTDDYFKIAPPEEAIPFSPVKTPKADSTTDIDFSQIEIIVPSFKNRNSEKVDTTVSDQPLVPAEPKKKNKVVDKVSDNSLNEENTEQFKSYRLPPIDCLSPAARQNNAGSEEELRVNGQKLIDTLNSFGIQAKITMISRGPSVTRYELQPSPGVRINRITKLADDIALALAASSVRIEAPIPNKSAIGVEIPNKTRSNVSLREMIESEQFRQSKSKLNIALGKDITGNAICADLDKMPHLLIAGTTGSGKSVCMNSLIVSLLFNASPDEVKLLLIDPKQGVELGPYNGIAHLEIPVVEDARKAAGALSWAVTEVINRYKIFNENKVRNISAFNELAEKTDGMKKLHRIVIFIDELNDLMMLAPHEVEDSICRLAQMARAAGIHLVIATQRPSVDVITGVIKANIPSRIALSVPSNVDSRTIIDMNGAEKLLGNGDMLFSPVGIAKPIRLQGCFISNKDIERTVNYIKSQSQASYDEEIIKDIDSRIIEVKKKGSSNTSTDDDEREDELLSKAIEVIADAQVASTTFLQRKLKIGYARAANLIDTLEQRHIVGPPDGSKPRKVLISKQQWMEMYALSDDSFFVADES